MSFVKFFVNNGITTDDTVLTASSEDAFFPASNLKNPFTTKVYRSVTGVTSANVVIDTLTSEEADSLLIKGSTIDGFGFNGDLTFEANGADVWTSPAFSTTITPNSEFNLAIQTLSPSQNYRFWRVSGTGTSFFELSTIFIGKFVQMTTNNIDFGWSYINRDISKISRNRYGQRFIDQINDSDEIKATFKLLNKTELDIILDVFDTVGRHTPFWFIVDEDEIIVNDKERFFNSFYLTQRPEITNDSFGLYSLSFNIVEAT